MWIRPLEARGCLDLWQKLSSESCGLWDGGLTVTLAPRHLCWSTPPSCKMDGKLSLLNSRKGCGVWLVGTTWTLREKDRKGGAFSWITSSGYEVFWLIGLLNFTRSYLYQSGKSSFRLFRQVHTSYSALCYSSQRIHESHYSISGKRVHSRVLSMMEKTFVAAGFCCGCCLFFPHHPSRFSDISLLFHKA